MSDIYTEFDRKIDQSLKDLREIRMMIEAYVGLPPELKVIQGGVKKSITSRVQSDSQTPKPAVRKNDKLKIIRGGIYG